MRPIFGLVDINNCYCSCQRVFEPALAQVPIVVTGPNGGNIVARSAEVKAAGIPMGAPVHLYRKQLQAIGAVIMGSNFELYADMSRRFFAVLRQFTPELEMYSVDEGFLALEGLPEPLLDYGQRIRQTVLQWTGLPTSIGIGYSKTQAKLANHLAKKQALFNGVCDLTRMSEHSLLGWTQALPVTEVWGISKATAERLARLGIHTVAELRAAPPDHLRTHGGVVLERIVRELNGESCLALNDLAPPRQQILCSRSFGTRLTQLDDILPAIAHFVRVAVMKLQREQACCQHVSVFLNTPWFRPEMPQHHPSQMVSLPAPTQDIAVLTRTARELAMRLFRPGFEYHKAGIILLGLQPQDQWQGDLFMAESQPTDAVAEAMQRISDRFGSKAIALGAEHGLRWRSREINVSPSWTTRWRDLPVVNV